MSRVVAVAFEPVLYKAVEIVTSILRSMQQDSLSTNYHSHISYHKLLQGSKISCDNLLELAHFTFIFALNIERFNFIFDELDIVPESAYSRL